MNNLTQKSSKQFLGVAMRVVTLALFLVVFGVGAALAQTRGYVANVGSDTVSVIDTATNTVVATVPVVSGPFSLAVTPNEAFAYVANLGSNNVSVISTATNTVVATVPVGAGPTGIAITPNGAFAYVVNRTDSTISVINTATDTVATTITGIAVGPFFCSDHPKWRLRVCDLFIRTCHGNRHLIQRRSRHCASWRKPKRTGYHAEWSFRLRGGF